MKKLYVKNTDVEKILEDITRTQTKNKLFVNVQVKTYRGKKYPRDTVVICIG